MKKERVAVLLGTSLLVTVMMIGCGSSTSDTKKGQGSTAVQETEGNHDTQSNDGGTDESGSASNIPYLRQNHANYKEHGSNTTPVGVKDASAKSIHWTISANTQEDAIKLQEHLKFMEERLQNNQNPRAWDKLFLMEAYMKYNNYYTTSVERSGTDIVVSKNATTTCAYEIISAHADAVSGDFFARGAIMVDYSAKAENILDSSACSDIRTSALNYIAQRQKHRGK